MTFLKKILCVFLIGLLFIACNAKEDEAGMTSNDDGIIDIKSMLNIVSKKKIYFGHKSVGSNIIEGIKDILNENSFSKLTIKDCKSAEDFNAPIFAHSSNGENGNPISKIDSFSDTIDNSLSKKVDIAFFKFCYVDIVNTTDIQNIFSYYTDKMNKLKNKYTHIMFIHFTVPLSTYKKMSLSDKLNDFVRSITGKETIKARHLKSNIVRNKYNEMLRKHYRENELFDLAGVESINQNGKKETIENEGISYESLIPDYSNDGGHLNEDGRKRVALYLLKFLSELD